MKFDGKTYLASCIDLKFKNFDNEYTHATVDSVVDAVSSLYSDKELDISFGSIHYNQEYNEESRFDTEYIEFHPNKYGEINIQKIEIGNRHNFDVSPKLHRYNILVDGKFSGTNDSIKALIELDDRLYRLAQATIVINDKLDPRRGIYCINMKNSRYEDCEVTIEYFDGDTLDLIKNTDSGYSVDEITSYSSDVLALIGFAPDKIIDFGYWEIARKYNTEMDIVGSTFANGSKDKFDKWIDKVFAKENKGPVLNKKNK